MDLPILILWMRPFTLLGVFLWMFSFYCIFLQLVQEANTVDPDQMPQSAVFELGLHCKNVSPEAFSPNRVKDSPKKY